MHLLAANLKVCAIVAGSCLLLFVAAFLAKLYDSSKKPHPHAESQQQASDAAPDTLQSSSRSHEAQAPVAPVSPPQPPPAKITKDLWFSSPYSVDYKIFTDGIKVTVKGPAAKLAVILTNPEGKTRIDIIDKDQMISNSHTVTLSMGDQPDGTYILAVKTVDPEKLVWQKELPLFIGQLTAKDIDFGFPKGHSGSIAAICLQEPGNLPVAFKYGEVFIEGTRCDGDIFTLVGRPDWVAIYLNWIPPLKEEMDRYNAIKNKTFLTPVFATLIAGKQYMVKITLFYGDGSKSVSFEKKCTYHEFPKL